jgi:hypothetical protein
MNVNTNFKPTPKEFASAILETMDDMLAAARSTDSLSWHMVMQGRDKIINMQKDWVEVSEKNNKNLEFIKEKLKEIEESKCC